MARGRDRSVWLRDLYFGGRARRLLRSVGRLERAFPIARIGFDHAPQAERGQRPENQKWKTTDEANEAENDENESEKSEDDMHGGRELKILPREAARLISLQMRFRASGALQHERQR